MNKIISATLIFLVCLSSANAQTKEVRKVDSFTKISFRVPGKLYLRQGTPQKVEIEGNKEFLKEVETTVEGNRLRIGKEGDWNWNWGSDDKVNVYITIPTIEGLNVSGSGDLIGESKFTVADLDLNVSGSGSLQIEADANGDVGADVSGSGEITLSGKCRSFESKVSGSGKVKLTETISQNATFGVSGSGKIEASGTVSAVKATISGSGKVLASNLAAETCDIRISGSGDVEITVNKELDANISGSGSVTYKGNPSHVNSHSSGSGHVRKM